MFGVTRRADDNTRMEPTDSKLQGIISCFDQFYNVRSLFLGGGIFTVLDENEGNCEYEENFPEHNSTELAKN